MRTLDVERLATGDYVLVKPLLVELHLTEQSHYADHPQLPREEIERYLTQVPSAFRGENVIYAVRDEVGQVVGFCWIVDRKSTRLNSSHVAISYAVFCLKKKTT